MQTGAVGRESGQSAAKRRSPEMEHCMMTCVECARVCLETIPQCLQAGGQHAMPDHITMLMNCARICETSAEFLLSGTRQHVYTCGACAQVCRECADDCARTGPEPFMQHCAEVCRRCAESCRAMAGH
jgi:hypothetical protein